MLNEPQLVFEIKCSGLTTYTVCGCVIFITKFGNKCQLEWNFLDELLCVHRVVAEMGIWQLKRNKMILLLLSINKISFSAPFLPFSGS